MAILIFKSRAQSKGAMTQQATANSTFIASLFILEYAMRKETCLKNKLNYSRMKARKLFKQRYCSNLPSNIVIHHKDNNSFNNKIENLQPMLFCEHISYHASKSQSWGRKKKSNEQYLKELESMLVIFNDR